MNFLKKFFYTTVETEGDQKEDKVSEEEEPNPFLTDFPEDNRDSAKGQPSDARSVHLNQNDLDFVGGVAAQTDFTASHEFEDSDGKLDLNGVLRSGGVDREAEEAGGIYTMEKVWALVQEGVPKASLPAVIKVSGKTVEAIIQDALRKGTICDEFEEKYRQGHQAQLQGITEEMNTVEQETDAEIQRIKEETELKIRELEERRRNGLEELRTQKQDAVAKFDRDIALLDSYEAQCAEVVKALKSTVPSNA